MDNIIVETQNLKKYYIMQNNTIKALDGINISIQKGEFVAFIGKSGSGKSTLLRMLGGLDTPTDGEVIIANKKLSKMNKEKLTIFRRRYVGFVFQNYNLVPDLNIYENITLPLELDGSYIDTEYIDALIKVLQLEEKEEMLPSMLSGGQQQRVAIARALSTKPAIVLADEPTGNLDSATSHDVLGLLKFTAKQFHQTLIIITHDNDIAQLADKIIRIEDGKIKKEGENYDREQQSLYYKEVGNTLYKK